jgi:hypothetical protein
MQAGFATRCITPAVGAEIPGLFEKRFARGAADDLFVHAAVVDDGAACVALVQVDAIAVPGDTVAQARKRVTKLTGIPGKHVLVSATHTHSGGPVADVFRSEPDPAYLELIANQIAQAVEEAHRLRSDGLMGTGASACDGVAFNRRFVMRDGSQCTHPGKLNPDIVAVAGPEDPTVTVVGFCEPETMRPLGCVVHFACHATHMNGDSFSADYPKWIRDTLQAVHGPDYGVVFVSGAAGDVTQMDNQSERSPEFGPYWAGRTGGAVGAAALESIAKMDYAQGYTVDAAAQRVRVNVRSTPKAALADARAVMKKRETAKNKTARVFAHELLEVEKLRRKSPMMRAEVQGLRLGDALIWSVPGELFQTFALTVEEDSPFPHTCCAGLANGYMGYICTREAFAGGGYEPTTARSSYLDQEAGNALVSAAKRLADRMYGAAAKEVMGVGVRPFWPGDPELGKGGVTPKRPR